VPWRGPQYEGELPSLGWKLLDWWADVLPSPREHSEPLVFTDDQARVLLDWYTFDPLTLRFIYRRGCSRRSKGIGKALALDTPLPTPSGWTTMGQVQVGDLLLDDDGQATEVVAATDVMTGRPCYRVKFRDGTTIVCDAEHLWPVEEFVGASRRRPTLVTTEQMSLAGVRFPRPLTTGRTKCTTPDVARWKTLPTPPIDGPDVAFPLPPYLLGYWLGDGDKDGPRVTVHKDDLPAFLAACERLGVAYGTPQRKPGTGGGDSFRVRFASGRPGGSRSVRVAAAVGIAALREMNVLNNKHIPAFAMRASYKQRLELLRGLMDSDGYVDRFGKIELTLTNAALADGAVELMRTLGLTPRMGTSDAKLNGRVVGTRYRISVAAYADEAVFSLARKVERLSVRPAGVAFSQVRTVVAVEPVGSVPVRCVSVSGPSRLYLAGSGMVPTHNSPVAAAKAIAALAGDVRVDGYDAAGEPVGRPWGTKGDPNPWVQIAAVSEDQTENTYAVLYEFLTANDGAAADSLGIDVGLTRCYLKKRPGRLEPVTASAGSREGQPVTDAFLDEVHLWTPTNGGVRLARTLRRNVAKMGGRSYDTTNSYAPGEGSVAEDTHKAVMAGQQGIYYDAVEAPEVKPEDSDDTLKAALAVAYGDAYWVDLSRLVAEVRDPDTQWEDAERYFFNHNIDDRRKAVETKRWEALKRPDIVVPPGAYIGVGFDGSISDDCTALVGCTIIDGVPHTFVIEVWQKPVTASRRHTHSANTWRVPRAEVREKVAETFRRYDVGLMLCDPAKWQTEIELWAEEAQARRRAAGLGKLEDQVAFFDTNQPTRMWKACDRFSTALAEGIYTHDGSSVLTAQVLAMHKRKVRVRDEDDDGRTKFVFVKGPNHDKIDAGIGAVLALEAARTMPPQRRVLAPMMATDSGRTSYSSSDLMNVGF
jgi:LAGLIDADG-like domain